MSDSLPLKGFLLLSDLDGTLLLNGREVPRRDIEAIRRFKALGGLMSVATGRTELSAGRFTTLFEPNAPGVLYNGAALYDFSQKKFLRYEELGSGVTGLIDDVVRHFPKITVEIYTTGGIYLSGNTRFGIRHMHFEKIDYHLAEPVDTPRPWIKAIFAGEEGLVDEVKAYLDGCSTDGFHFTRSGPIFYEVLPVGATKGTGLRHVAGLCGVKMENTFAIGDYYNDLELLREAATSFTVRGAPDDLKAEVDVVVGTCEEGAVADAIEWILSRQAAL